MTTEQNKEIATKFISALAAYDAVSIERLMRDDATYWVAGKPHLFPMAGEMPKQTFCELMSGSSPFKNGMSMKIHNVVAEGDHVALETESHGVLENGKIYNNNYVFLIRIDDGKIISAKEYMDPQHATEIFLGG